MLPRTIPDPRPGEPFRELNPEPFRIEPKFLPRIWGAQSLAQIFPEKTNLRERIGEAWLTATDARVETGQFAGKTLAVAWREMPESWRGRDFFQPGEFPLLVKFIFPTDKLSIQVHPDDAYAAAHEKAAGGRGKTEMWHIVSAEAGARLLAGLKPGVSKGDFLAAMGTDRLEGLFQSHEVHAGDTFFLAAGTPHTIGPNMVVCEVQQYSDLTYRVHDYGRRDASGRERELHLEKALDVIQFGVEQSPRVVPKPWVAGRESLLRLVQCAYFDVDLWKVTDKVSLKRSEDSAGQGFSLLVGLEGEGQLTWAYPVRQDAGMLTLKRGECWFVPANTLGSYTVHPQGNLSLLWVSVPTKGL